MGQIKKYKKYILFRYDDYYPSGGLGDICSSFNTINEAKEYVKSKNTVYYDNNELVDRDTWEIVKWIGPY